MSPHNSNRYLRAGMSVGNTMAMASHNIPRIAVVIPQYGPVGGAERFACEVTERMASTGRYEFHVYTNSWQATSGSPVVFHKVPIIKFPRSLRPWSFPWFARRAIESGQFDLVHSHDRIFRANVFSVHCVPHLNWVCSVRQKRVSIFDRTVTAVERRMMRSSAAEWFLPVSSLAMEAFRRTYSELHGQWRIMHPGVDATRFASPDREVCRREIRGRHGISDRDLLVLFVGMNFEVKGLDAILAALAKARTKANVRLLVVGRGNESKYRQLTHFYGIDAAVTFVGPQIAGLEQYYRAADIFIMLSLFDTFGMVVLEAMAAGLPVIVSPNVGAKDLVVEGKNGFVLPSAQDIDTAAERILQLRDPVRWIAMSANACHTAAQHDWDGLARQLEMIYQQVLDDKRERGRE